VIDSHTGGEPTRVVVASGPDLGGGSLAERRIRFRDHFDEFRSAVIDEPRGSDVLIGALLCEPAEPDCVAGVIFFNIVGVLNMCGHGTIGVVVTLAHMGRVGPGSYRLDTPVGVVGFEFDGKHTVTIENVPSYRHAAGVRVDVDGFGPVVGDVAWGGNWFFLTGEHGQRIERSNVEALTDYTWRRAGAGPAGITGKEGGEIDHIELFGPPRDPANNVRNFVLCPGKAYTVRRAARAPARQAGVSVCRRQAARREPGLAAESIAGSVFEGTVRIDNGRIIPRVTGTALRQRRGQRCYSIRTTHFGWDSHMSEGGRSSWLAAA
jgi:4-hydroxyproline epimerase